MESKTNTQNAVSQVAVMTTGKDLMTSLLIVSVLVNLAVLIAWLAISLDPTVSVIVTTS